MALLGEWSEKQEHAWNTWVRLRPPVIQDLCSRFPANRLYRLKESAHYVTIYSYEEDGTMTVTVSGDRNFVIFERHVFGVAPDEIEECDLPSADSPHGSLL